MTFAKKNDIVKTVEFALCSVGTPRAGAGSRATQCTAMPSRAALLGFTLTLFTVTLLEILNNSLLSNIQVVNKPSHTAYWNRHEIHSGYERFQC